MPSSPEPSAASPRKSSRLFGFLFAYFEERTVGVTEIELLLPTHRNEWLRPEIEEKLARLDLANPVHVELDRLVRLSLALLEAVDRGAYRKPRGWARMDPWLRRALAYFVKTYDAIPDHFADGFDDDHREFRELEERLAGTLLHFEVWEQHRKTKSK